MVDLWEAVALSLDMNPEAIEKAARGSHHDYGIARYDRCDKDFVSRIKIAVSRVEGRDLIPAVQKPVAIYCKVRLPEFAAWARETMGWEIPETMATLSVKTAAPANTESDAAAIARVLDAEPTLWCNSDEVKLSQTDRLILWERSGWKSEELAAIALHRKPDAVNKTTMRAMQGNAVLAGEFERLLDLIERAVAVGELRPTETPSNCLQWLLDHRELEDLDLWPWFTAGKGKQVAPPTEVTTREPAEVATPELAVKRVRKPDAKAVREIERKCRAVVAAGQDMKNRNPRWTIHYIARQLCNLDRAEGLGEDATRKILSGSYPAAINLGISGISTKKPN